LKYLQLGKEKVQMSETVNTQLVESLVQTIRALPIAEQSLLLQKLLDDIPYPSTLELMHLADKGGSFNFWYKEPDLYTIEDGEPVEWS
jgi:hypothetical protein